MYICANPTCLCLTGYGTTEGRARTIAEAAHIHSASKKGPRAKPTASAARVKSVSNGIWLCRVCHAKVDADIRLYSAITLRTWKRDHEDVVRRIVGSDLEAALLDLRNHKRYHDETRAFVSFLESKRVLYEGMDHEFPPRVLESLELIRERLVQTRAKVNPDTDLFVALNRLQTAVSTFLREIGEATDLRTLRCNGSDPVWRKFSTELGKLRNGIVIIAKLLSGKANYKLTWM